MSEYADLRRELRTAREVARQNADAILAAARKDGRDLEPVEEAALNSQMAAAARADAGLRALPEPEPARAKRPTYFEGGRDSFFRDLIAVRVQEPIPGNPPHQAQARLAEHAAETAASRRLDAEIAERRASKYGLQVRGESGEVLSYREELPQRRDLSQSAGLGIEFSPPLWLTDHFVNVARSDAPLFRCAEAIPLPPQTGFEVLLPTFTQKTGGQVAPPAQNTNPTPDDITSSSLSSFVAMLVSYTVCSYQALEQGGVDRWLTQAAAEDLSAEIESVLWAGTGDAEPTGVLNSGTGSVAYSGSSTGALWQTIGGASVEVGNSRLKYPEAIFATPAYCSYLMGYQDANNTPTQRVTTPTDYDGPAVGFGAGLPLIPDGALPTEFGTFNNNVIAVGRPSDLLVLTSDPVHRVADAQTLGDLESSPAGVEMESYGAAMAAVVMTHMYIAAICRYPSGWAYVENLANVE